jgi:polyisoprenoid-binding protein YceI
MPRRLAQWFLLAAWLPLLAHAREAEEPVRWLVDSSRSQALFKVRLWAIVPLAGSFDTIEGAIVFDVARAEAQVEAQLPSASLRMRSAAHAKWARSKDFFDTARHPLIRFQSNVFPQQVLRQGGRIDGELTLRGITRPMTFRVEPGECDPARSARCTVDVAGLVRRSEFGMQANPGTVSDWVNLKLHIVANRG